MVKYTGADTETSGGTADIGQPCEHINPVCICNTTDGQRAELLREYLEALANAEWTHVRLMPMGEGGKQPVIKGQCKLDTDQARSLLHTPSESVNATRAGHPGFFIYAGKSSHGTTGLVFFDRDEPDRWPASPPTLRVVSGSGIGDHLTYFNGGDLENAQGKGELKGIGSVHAKNLGVVTPGSIHPSGGIYHVAEKPGIVEPQTDFLPAELLPANSACGPSRWADTGTDEDEISANDPIEAFTIEEAEVDVAARLSQARQSKKGKKIGALLDGNYARCGFEGDRSGAEMSLAYYLKVFLDNDLRLVYLVIDEACQRRPWTDWGEKRKWLRRNEEYRWKTITNAYSPHVSYEDFDDPLPHVANEERPEVSYVTRDKAMYIIAKEGPVSKTEIVDHEWFDRSRTQATEAIRELRKCGVVEMHPDEDDGRIMLYSIAGSIRD